MVATTAPGVDLVVQPSPRPDDESAARFEAGQRSAAYWNSLLMWAREERGPQWDSSTALYMCDRNGPESTAYVEAAPKTDEEIAAEAARDGHHERTARSSRRREEGPNEAGLLTGDAYAKAFGSDAEDGEEDQVYVPRPSRSRRQG